MAQELSTLDSLITQLKSQMVPVTSDTFTYTIRDIFSLRASTATVKVNFGIRYDLQPMYLALAGKLDLNASPHK